MPLPGSLAANRARGEVLATLAGGSRRLCLTLGALAEIETALDVESPAAIAGRLRDPSAQDLLAVLGALLRGGGETAFADGLTAAPVDPREAAAAIAAAFVAAVRA